MSGYAFQWVLSSGGTIDGAFANTAFEWPDTLPSEGQSVDLPQGGTATMENGVVIFTLDAGIDLGQIDFNAIPGVRSPHGLWVKAFHANMSDQGAASPRAFEARLTGDGIPPTSLYAPLSAVAAGATDHVLGNQLATFWNSSYIPPGASLLLLADTENLNFAAAAPNGPASFYMELEVLRNDEEVADLMEMMDMAEEQALAHSRVIEFGWATASAQIEDEFYAFGRAMVLAALDIYFAGPIASGESYAFAPTFDADTIVNAAMDDSTGWGWRRIKGSNFHKFSKPQEESLLAQNYFAGGGPNAPRGMARYVFTPCWQLYGVGRLGPVASQNFIVTSSGVVPQ